MIPKSRLARIHRIALFTDASCGTQQVDTPKIIRLRRKKIVDGIRCRQERPRPFLGRESGGRRFFDDRRRRIIVRCRPSPTEPIRKDINKGGPMLDEIRSGFAGIHPLKL